MIIKNYNEARHLSSRLELGVDHAATQARIGKSISSILNSMIPAKPHINKKPAIPADKEIASFMKKNKEGTKQVKKEIRNKRRKQGRKLGAWWINEINITKYPLQERMTLFWHNHFTSSIKKVKWPQYMFRQNQLLRTHALSNFADLLHAIIRDPAMLIYLDGRKNSKQNPNENLARELLELFTLGEGHYTEEDIKNTARALTGLTVNHKIADVRFLEKDHDKGSKTILGKTGQFDAQDVVTVLLEHPRTAELIAEKFWKEFINQDKPNQETIKKWAHIFKMSDYDIKVLLQTVIESDAFWDKTNLGSLIKSPIELTVGAITELQLNFKQYGLLYKMNAELGQALFNPPDVKGWRGGNSWIDNNRLVRRYDILAKLSDEFEIEKEEMRAKDIHKLDQADIEKLLLPIKAISTHEQDLNSIQLCRTLLQDPAYQLR